jgi:hypothetical protein
MWIPGDRIGLFNAAHHGASMGRKEKTATICSIGMKPGSFAPCNLGERGRNRRICSMHQKTGAQSAPYTFPSPFLPFSDPPFLLLSRALTLAFLTLLVL